METKIIETPIVVNGKVIDTLKSTSVLSGSVLLDYVNHHPGVKKELGGPVTKAVKVELKEGKVLITNTEVVKPKV